MMVMLCLPGLVRADDLTALSLEELMAIDMVSTPQFAGQIANLPASVSILTASDFRAYGWRTLADALRSLRGFNVTYDRSYSYVGVRGMSPPGDYKPRLNIMIDGIDATENIYDSVLIGGEFPLDIDLIERIEVVRGPSASVVGGDAMGGVINIITRSGAAMHGAEVATSAGSGEAYSGRGSVGGVSSNGVEYLLSASGYNAQGEELKFPDLAPLDQGVSTNLDGERRRQLFAKIGYDAWHATLIHGERNKTVPTGSYGTLFDDPAHVESDTETLAEIGHKAGLGMATTLTTRVFSGQYTFEGTYPYNDGYTYYRDRDLARGKWWGTEIRLQSHAWAGHQLMAGAEFIDNYQQDQRNDLVGSGCFGLGSAPCLDDRHNSTKKSIYGQDEILLAAQTRLTLGLRLDRTVDNDARLSPRVGLVQHTAQAGTFKLLYATAYREASVYEKYYTLPDSPSGNPGLDDEYLRSIEGIWEYAFDAHTQFTTVIYQYQAEHVVAPDSAGIYQNLPTITGRGAEFEFNRIGRGGTALRTSYALQFPELAGDRPTNAPQQLLKLNLSQPIPATAWNAGIEVQATSKRDTEVGTTLGGYGITNLNLVYAPHGQAWELALGLYNFFDKQYKDPIALDKYMDPRVFRDGIAQDGRTWRAKLTCKF